MTPPTTLRVEERAARDQLRAIKRAHTAKTKANLRPHAAVIRDELARPRATECRCPITPRSTIEQLRALCTGKRRWRSPDIRRQQEG